MELLDIELGLFTATAPDNRPSLVVDLKHVQFRPFGWKTEDSTENESYVAHQVDRVIVDDNIPRRIKNSLLACFSFRLLVGRHFEILASRRFGIKQRIAGIFDLDALRISHEMATATFSPAFLPER